MIWDLGPKSWRQAWVTRGPRSQIILPTVKHTGQESGGKLCEILKFWWFLQSESVNSVCKTASVSGELRPPNPPTGASPLDPLGDFRPPDTLGYSTPNKNSLRHHSSVCVSFVCPRRKLKLPIRKWCNLVGIRYWIWPFWRHFTSDCHSTLTDIFIVY